MKRAAFFGTQGQACHHTKKGRLRWNHLNALPIRDIFDRWINKYVNHSVDLLIKLTRDLE
ncbi:MAG TPA: ArsR family transcriptional regulator [Blastocatellia bacterium]|nr:ArsR family transcriptional regulator [Blastocatellia bacterium]